MIGIDGTVTSVRVLQRGVSGLAIAAIDAVRQWRFTPTLLNGSPVEAVMNVSVAFKPDGDQQSQGFAPGLPHQPARRFAGALRLRGSRRCALARAVLLQSRAEGLGPGPGA
jgi:hypothetical protein